MAPTEFHEALGTLGLAQQRVAQLFGVGPRSVRRWQYGERRVPCGVDIVVRLLAAGMVTVEQVEQAASLIPSRTNGGPEPSAPLPVQGVTVEQVEQVEQVQQAEQAEQIEQVAFSLSARMNGGAEPEPPAPLHLEPTSEPSTSLAESALEPSAILADPVTAVGSELTTAEKVAALTARACRWPCGDPQHSDFHFCGGAVVAPPYCEEHRAVAYLEPPSHPAPRRRRRRLYASARRGRVELRGGGPFVERG